MGIEDEPVCIHLKLSLPCLYHIPEPPTLLSGSIVKIEEEETDLNQTCQHGCCVCPKDKETLKMEEDEALFQKEFENFLHNNVFIQR